jgi:hypothetical protein
MLKAVPVLLLYIVTSITCYSQDYSQIKSQLEDINRTDQQYRIILDSLVRKAGLDWNHPQIQKLVPIAARQDSLNLVAVKTILDKQGWLGMEKIGEKANETLFLVIQHADSATIIHYFPLLVKSYEMGSTSAKYYALMLDRILVERGQKQVYGTQIQMTKANGRFIPFPIEEETTVNSRRKKTGLQPLEKYLKEINQ